MVRRRPVAVLRLDGPTPVLNALTALYVAVFFAWQAALSGSLPGWLPTLERTFLTSPSRVDSAWGLLSLLGSALSHIDPMHLAFNVLALWVLGRDVERVIGAGGFLHLVVAGGIVASAGHLVYGLATGSDVPALGASGSVMAVAVVSAVLFPDRMLLVFFILPMRQVTAVGLFILVDLFGLLNPGADSIAHAAHLGGALYGWVYFRRHLRSRIQARLAAIQRAREAVRSPWDHPVA